MLSFYAEIWIIFGPVWNIKSGMVLGTQAPRIDRLYTPLDNDVDTEESNPILNPLYTESRSFLHTHKLDLYVKGMLLQILRLRLTLCTL